MTGCTYLRRTYTGCWLAAAPNRRNLTAASRHHVCDAFSRAREMQHTHVLPTPPLDRRPAQPRRLRCPLRRRRPVTPIGRRRRARIHSLLAARRRSISLYTVVASRPAISRTCVSLSFARARVNTHPIIVVALPPPPPSPPRCDSERVCVCVCARALVIVRRAIRDASFRIVPPPTDRYRSGS